MRVVVALALGALVALIIALVSGSTLVAVLVVLLALAGIVALLRDWRSDSGPAPAAQPTRCEEPADADPLTADELSPDIADQI